jgi:hypothetical protein
MVDISLTHVARSHRLIDLKVSFWANAEICALSLKHTLLFLGGLAAWRGFVFRWSDLLHDSDRPSLLQYRDLLGWTHLAGSVCVYDHAGDTKRSVVA